MIINKLIEQVKKYPNRLAVKTGSDELTYQELDHYANTVALEMIDKRDGISLDARETVALLFEHGNEMIIGKFGALKAAKIYVPMDPTYPVKLLAYMLADSEASLIITNDQNVELAKGLVQASNREVEIININKIKNGGSCEQQINPQCDGDEIAYILYTSGSTGRPKGVMQSHRNVLHFAECYGQTIAITPEDKMTLLSSFSHDAGIGDIYAALLNGASLHPLDVKSNLSMDEIAQWLQESQISIWYSVPTLYRHFVNAINPSYDFPTLRFIILGGEAVLPHDVALYQKAFPSAKFAIMYGQSESSINSFQIYTADSQVDVVTLGAAVQETELVVLNEQRKKVKPLHTGEIVILSNYVARGYWKNEAKSNEVFKDIPGAGRAYVTGDLGKLLPDGSIEFIGRKDFQVKIRGYRIELGGIENQLVALAEIKEAVVTAFEEDSGEKYLCAYIISETDLTASELRDRLSENLPDYMVPSYFVKMKEFPLTPSGKVDRKALPEPSTDAKAAYVAPRNMTEATLARIWGEVLKKAQVGINDDFFELGGNSLKGIELASKIHKEFNVAVPLRELFQAPTIAALSEYMELATESVYADIKPAAEKEYYEASAAQKRMWLLWQFEQTSTAYNMPGVLIIDGALDISRLEAVFLALIERHELLRTTFGLVDGTIVQRIANDVEFKIEYAKSRSDDIEATIKTFIRPFDLSRAPLLRVVLIQTSETRHYLLFDMHHIIADGVSMAILRSEFVALYERREIAEQRIGYKDFSQWQNEYLKSEKMKAQENYWLEQFSGEIPLLNLPLDYPRPAVQSFEGGSVEFSLNRASTEQLNSLARATNTTMYMVLLSMINVLLLKYTGQTDIIVGSPIAGRPHPDLEGIIGMFVNTLAMRNFPTRGKTYVAFLNEVKETALAAYENQDYQFEELVDKLNLRRDLSRNPLFDVMFVLQNMEVSELAITGLQLTEYNIEQISTKFDLTFTATEINDEIMFSIRYCRGLFKSETIQQLARHLQNLVEMILMDQEMLLGDIVILSKAEREQMLYEFNDTEAEYPRDKTIQQLFAEQVAKTPEAVALVFNGERLTYSQLNEKANQMARILRTNGVKADDIVGLMVEPSFELVIGILGILKSGGAYLPIDPEYPEERIKFMLEDSGTEILLSQSWLSEKIEFAKKTINFNKHGFDRGQVANLEIVNSSSDLAYVIYTSGSTGKPKGVMVEHKNIVNLALGQIKKTYQLNEGDRVLQSSPISFDPAMEQIFIALLSGAALYLINKETLLNLAKLHPFLRDHGITYLYHVPSFLKNLDLSELNDLRVVVSGGEPCPVELAERLCERFEFYNGYGPAEATVKSAMCRVNLECIGASVPIGKPVSNSKIYILNDNNELPPLGVPGELCISGAGVARGYLNRPELTKEKFVANPFISGERMYRTGDLARFLPDGKIEFLGRIDHQVKIRGYRIELGEIEKQILKYRDIKEAVVLAREDEAKDKYLCAYIVSAVEVMANEIRQYLAAVLPDYMIPSYFVQLAGMPLTPNGKVDRKALPEPVSKGSADYVAPRNQVEETLVQIWGEVLGKSPIGINDNFFELGGHSLKATVVLARIHKELNAELPLKELFRTPTISEISDYLANAKESVYASIKPVVGKEYYEVSSAQKRMWHLWQFDQTSTAYNMPRVLIVEGILDKSRLEHVLLALIERHELLRTTFGTVDGVIVQRMATDIEFKIEYTQSNSDSIEEAIKTSIRPFNLSQAPLLRVVLIQTGETQHYLLFDMHHIISDGVSMSTLTKEFMALYEGRKLKPQRIQYKDFSQWQNEYLKSARVKAQENYWLEQFSGEIPTLNLALDYTRPAVQNFEGASVEFSLNHELTEKLNQLAQETGATLYMVLLSVINILLSLYTGQEDIIIGTPIAGRPHADLETIMGLFVNTLAMRNYPESGKTYEEFLSEVKETALKAFENQDYQFEELVDKLNLRRDISRNPLFDVMFVLQNMEAIQLEVAGLKFTRYSSDQGPAIVDLIFMATEIDDEIVFNVRYCTSLFKRETIEGMTKHLQNLIDVVTTDKTVEI